CRARHLRKRRIPPGPSGTAQELRPRPGRGDVGAPAVRLLPAAAAAATGIQVGSAIVATRFVVDQTGPASLALLRYLIGVCCLLPPVLMSAPRARFDRRDLLAIGLLGIAQFGILIALLNYGLRLVPSARAALIFATLPLLTMVVAAALGQERLTLAKLSGVLRQQHPGATDAREALRGAADARGRGAGARGEGVSGGRRGPRV